jgi:ADP-ribose pyrophosphatase
MSTPDTAWRVLDRSLAFDAAPRLKVWRESVALPDGRQVDDYYQVALPDFVVLVAVTPDDRAVMLKGYKHGVRQECLTFPGGLLEPGEDPEEAARRELVEETGFVCEDIASLGAFVVNGNQRCATGHVFYGSGARLVAARSNTDLEAATRLLLPFGQLPAHVGFDGFNLMPHALALGLAVMHRGRCQAREAELAHASAMD